MPRRKIGTIRIETQAFNKWHYGIGYSDLRFRLKYLMSNGWQPEVVAVTTLNSVWWEAARDTITEIKKQFFQRQK
jgi:hypothetical protein